MTRTYEYIDIRWAGRSDSGKTDVYDVTNRERGTALGVVKWWGRWRQYAFLPAGDCVFSAGCLTDIADAIAVLMSDRKAAP